MDRKRLALLLLTIVLVTPSFSQTRIWKQNLKANIVGAPIIGGDGTVYAASEDGYLRAYRPGDGGLKWEFRLQQVPTGAPAMQGDMIYVPTRRSAIQAVHNSGNGTWERVVEPHLVGAPAVSGSGHIYFVTDDQGFYSIDGSGLVRWRYNLPAPAAFGPVVMGDGTLRVACRDLILAMDEGGGVHWTYDIVGNPLAPLAAGDSGRVYAVDQEKNMHCVGSFGQRVWRSSIGGDVSATPAVSLDKIFVVTSTTARSELAATTYTLKTLGVSDGQPVTNWSKSVGGLGSPAIGADLTLYLADASSKTLKVLDIDPEASTPLADVVSAIPLNGKGGDVSLVSLASGGRLALATLEPRLYCFEVPKGPAGDAPWSQAGATARHQSRRDTPPVMTVADIEDGDTVSGTEDFRVYLEDDQEDGLVVRLYLDGKWTYTANRSPYDFSWVTTGTINGPRLLFLEAVDLAGNVVSETLEVTVENEAPDPPEFYADDPPFTFSWPAQGEESFEVQFSPDPSFVPVIATSSSARWPWIHEDSWTPSNNNWQKILSVAWKLPFGDATGYWRVIGKTLGPMYSGTYAVLAAEPSIPGAPADGEALDPEYPPTFTWDFGHNCKAQVEFSDSQGFQTGALVTSAGEQNTWITRTSWTPSQKKWKRIQSVGSTVYWRVKSKDLQSRETLSTVSSFVLP